MRWRAAKAVQHRGRGLQGIGLLPDRQPRLERVDRLERVRIVREIAVVGFVELIERLRLLEQLRILLRRRRIEQFRQLEQWGAVGVWPVELVVVTDAAPRCTAPALSSGTPRSRSEVGPTALPRP